MVPFGIVWGPSQKTPIHDHTVWGLVGVMRGSERARSFGLLPDGTTRPEGDWDYLMPGDVDKLSPVAGDIHQVENAVAAKPSISIHVYSANIGAVRRHVFDAGTSAVKPFVSGYSSQRYRISGIIRSRFVTWRRLRRDQTIFGQE
jgi:predicted metal-dependent enzyme (double-stranded beta helix superfamily)